MENFFDQRKIQARKHWELMVASFGEARLSALQSLPESLCRSQGMETRCPQMLREGHRTKLNRFGQARLTFDTTNEQEFDINYFANPTMVVKVY